MTRLLWLTGVAVFLLVAVFGIGAIAQDCEAIALHPASGSRYPNFELDILVDGRPLSEHNGRGEDYVEAVEAPNTKSASETPRRIASRSHFPSRSQLHRARQTTAWNSRNG